MGENIYAMVSNISLFFIVFVGFHSLLLAWNGELRLGDIFQYCLNIFGTSKIFTKYRPLDPLFITKLLQKNKKTQNMFWTYYFSHLNTLEIQKCSKLWKVRHAIFSNIRFQNVWKYAWRTFLWNYVWQPTCSGKYFRINYFDNKYML